MSVVAFLKGTLIVIVGLGLQWILSPFRHQISTTSTLLTIDTTSAVYVDMTSSTQLMEFLTGNAVSLIFLVGAIIYYYVESSTDVEVGSVA